MANSIEIDDCRGRKVVCSEENWCDKILGSRPWMKGWEKIVSDAVHDPMFICEDSKNPGKRQIFYKLHQSKGNKYIKVVVVFSSKHVGHIITAFPTDSAKDGEKVIWMPSSN